MRRASEIAGQQSASDPTIVGEQTCTFLRKIHPRATAENVAADLKLWRVKSATIAKMLERRSAPSTPLFIALFCAYGPEFLVATVPGAPKWLDEAAQAQERATIRAQIDALETRLERL